MPIILPLFPDPADLIVSGEQMRQAVLDDPVAMQGAINNGTPSTGFSSVVQDEDVFTPIDSFMEIDLLSMSRFKSSLLQTRDGAGIATPCGAWLSKEWDASINPLMFATVLWAISGVTKDSTGAALAGVRVVAFETGRIDLGAPIIGETVSDGSGNYSIPVPTNTGHQLVGYLPGSPDVAGVTRRDVTPTAIG